MSVIMIQSADGVHYSCCTLMYFDVVFVVVDMLHTRITICMLHRVQNFFCFSSIQACMCTLSDDQPAAGPVLLKFY